MNPHIFRRYDIRGVADRDLTHETVSHIARAFGSHLVKTLQLQRPSLVLGRDIRPSSERIHKSLVAALLGSGVSIADIGVVTTPICYFSVLHFKHAAGIMVTGSHNPTEYNGLKFVIGRQSFFGDDIQNLRALIEKKDFVTGQGQIQTIEIIPAYRSYLKQLFQFKKRWKVVVDSGNGTAGLVAPQLLRELGHEVVELFSKPDSRFPHHHPDPTVEGNLQHAMAKVREVGADVGLAFDGDGDRLGVVDEQGTIVWGDKLLILFSRFILEQHPGAKFVADVKCSRLFFEDVARHGGEAIMWKTGHALIKQKLKEVDALLGGEMSGHMFFADRYFGFDDGLYAGLRVLEILDQTGRKLSQLLSDVPRTFSTPEIRIDYPDDEKFQVVERVRGYFKKSRHSTFDLDGVRIDFGDGWGLLRASNTQPVLVMRFEASTAERLAELKRLVEDKVREFSPPHVSIPQWEKG